MKGQLCAGSIDLVNGAGSLAADDLLWFFDLDLPQTEWGDNTVWIDWTDRPVGCRALRIGSGTVARFDTSLRAAFGTMKLPPDFPFADQQAGRRGAVVPLFVATAQDREPHRRHIYNRLRSSEDDLIAIRTTDEPHAGGGSLPEEAWVTAAARLHEQNALFLGNHQRYYKKCFRGKELEVKFTLDPDADIWGLTVDLLGAFKRSQLPRFKVEYRDDFQAWDYPTRLFEVVEPAAERGYVSVIPTTDGRYVVKRKRFSADALVREEQISDPIRIEGSIAAYLEQRFPFQLRALPALRRVRYDVNFESLKTGHVYGVFFDRASVIGAGDIRQCQAELEYLRSRVTLRPNDDAVLSELDGLAGWLESFLKTRTLHFTVGYYSKLSFLRDRTAGMVDPSAGVLL